MKGLYFHSWHKLIIGNIFILVCCLGCASLGTYNPATGKNELIFISTSDEVAMGNTLHRKMLQEFKFSNNQAQINRINQIGQRLAQVSDRRDYQYKFYLIEKDELNAFTSPGGGIYFFTGLLNKLKSDDAIAGVLAHEIGHCAARHTIKKFQAALGYNLLTSLVFSQVDLGPQAQELANVSTNTAMQLVFSAYSREDELEADRLGIRYLKRAGFNVQGMIETLEVLKAESKGPSVPVILRTHPHLDDRIKKAKEQIQLVLVE